MIDLTTGVPGSGKSLLTVWDSLRPMVGSRVAHNDTWVDRHLWVAGIPDLLLEHQAFDAPPINVDTFTDPWGDVPRSPGAPAVKFARLVKVGAGVPRDHTEGGARWVPCDETDAGAQLVPHLAENWWLWVVPGDVLCIDEAQTTFRPMPAGKRAPGFIRKLEIHRHYGIDLFIVTQHPQLIHSAVRALVGRHRHVRRLLGRKAAAVYEWDHCSPPDRTKQATVSFWRYPRQAFALYKSAQLHTKQRFSTSWALLLGLVALLATPALWYFAFNRTTSGVGQAGSVKPGQAASAPEGQLGEAPRQAAAPATGQAPSRAFPESELSAVAPGEDPYLRRAFVLEGEWSIGRAAYAVFGLVVDGERVGTVSLAELAAAGYSWTRLGPCAGLLRLGPQARRVTCAKPVDRGTVAPLAPPAAPASASVA